MPTEQEVSQIAHAADAQQVSYRSGSVYADLAAGLIPFGLSFRTSSATSVSRLVTNATHLDDVALAYGPVVGLLVGLVLLAALGVGVRARARWVPRPARRGSDEGRPRRCLMAGRHRSDTRSRERPHG
jgi:hypothetical protein